jgi:solute:Na+ symporter, SSS family
MLGVSIFLYLLGTIFVGLLAARLVKSSKDFVLADRSLPLFLCTSAMFATWFGSETILGASARFAQEGIQGIIEEPFGAALCLILVGVLIARPLYRMNLLTINDFYKRRFGPRVELVSSIFMILSYLGWIAAQLLALAIVMKTVMGIPIVQGIWIGSGVVLLYTFFGGMWSISITDFIQTLMIIAGLVIVLIQMLNVTPDVGALIKNTPEGFFNILPEPTFKEWILYISAWITIGLGSIAQQDVFQRVMSAKSEKVAVLSSYISGVMYITIACIPLAIGFIGIRLYPALAQQSEHLLPSLVLNHSPMFVQILFFGALLSAIMSTASGAILAPATILGENILKPFFHRLSDKEFLWLLRGCVVLIVLAAVTLSLRQGSVFELVALSSSLSLVSLFVPLMAGLYLKKTTSLAAMLSIVFGFSFWGLSNISQYHEFDIIIGLTGSILGLVIGILLRPLSNVHEH